MKSKKIPLFCTGEHKWLSPGTGGGSGPCQCATVFCHSLTHLHGLVLKSPGLSCIDFPCSASSRATGHGGGTKGALEAVQTGNLLSICSFNAKSKSNRPVWAFPSDDPAQGAQAGVLCQPSKGGCDPSEKYPKQGLIY